MENFKYFGKISGRPLFTLRLVRSDVRSDIQVLGQGVVAPIS